MFPRKQHQLLVVALFSLSVLAFQGRAASAAPSDDEPKKPPVTANSCVIHTTQARYISGFDHLVHLQNKCEKPVTCSVSTDVNPKTQTVSLAPDEKTTVLTYRGSPAREFTATVDCSF